MLTGISKKVMEIEATRTPCGTHATYRKSLLEAYVQDVPSARGPGLG